MTHRMRRMTECRLPAYVAVLCFAAAMGAQTPAPKTPAAQAPATQVPEWKTYSYPADGFSASFPSNPEHSRKHVDTQAGAFELRSYMTEVQNGQVALFIGVIDFGSQSEGKDPDTVLQGTKNGAIKSSNSHLLSEKAITLGGHHGLEFESESDTARYYARIYLVGGTLYQTLVVSPVESPYADALRFLNSFQLIARNPN